MSVRRPGPGATEDEHMDWADHVRQCQIEDLQDDVEDEEDDDA